MSEHKKQGVKKFLAVVLLLVMTVGMLGTVASANENSDEKVHDYLDWVTFDQEIIGVEWTAYQAWPSDAISTTMKTYYRPVVYVPLGTTVALKPERINSKFRITTACNEALTSDTVYDFVMQRSFDKIQVQSTERVKYGIYDYQERGDEVYIYVHGTPNIASLDYSLYIIGVDMNALAVSGKRSFVDVSDSDFFAAPVAWAVERGITTGTSTYMFSPDETCTVGQILTFMWRANGSPEPTISNPFWNLSESDYAYKAALWAYETGVDTGDPTWQGPRYRGSDICRRLEAAECLWNAAGKPTPVNDAYFADVPATEYFAQAVAWAFEQKIATGVTAEKFDPYAPCTRGTIMTFLYRAMANQ